MRLVSLLILVSIDFFWSAPAAPSSVLVHQSLELLVLGLQFLICLLQYAVLFLQSIQMLRKIAGLDIERLLLVFMAVSSSEWS